ncbi:MAG: electron transfer flavoprotein subunit alpha/FixB family protein [Alkalispirochaeta sp.]
MSFVWTIAEQYKGSLKEISFELLPRGRALADALGTKLATVVIGNGIGDDALHALIAGGADEVYSIQSPELADFVCENYSNAIASIIKTYAPSIVLAGATTTGRTLMPHVAIRVGAGLTADCTDLAIEESTGNLLQTRPAIGGNILATIKTPHHRPQMATVRPRSTRPFPADSSRVGKIIAVPVDPEWIDESVVVEGYRREEEDFVNLEEAEVIVTAGRGIRKKENVALIEALARELGGEVGASRDVVDRGWLGYPHQVGLSGKTVSPRLYVAAGVSGSIQHLAGIKTSEAIVSINTDPDAGIHSVADLAVVGDLFTVIPALVERLRRSRS